MCAQSVVAPTRASETTLHPSIAVDDTYNQTVVMPTRARLHLAERLEASVAIETALKTIGEHLRDGDADLQRTLLDRIQKFVRKHECTTAHRNAKENANG
jgi:hypothetical protein